MNDNEKQNKLDLKKIINKKIKPLLKRNKSDLYYQSHTSKINNDSTRFQNKSELINPIREKINMEISKLSKNNLEKLVSKLETKFTNEVLFSKRINKGINLLNKMKKINLYNSHKNYLIKDASLSKFRNLSFLYPKKNPNQKVKNINISNQILSPISKNRSERRKEKIFFPKLNSKTIEICKSNYKRFNETSRIKKIEKEKEKENIKDNLIYLLYKIKQKILPKRKLKFEKNKLSDLDKLKKIKSCIHKEKNFRGKVEFIKTHLDGINKPKDNIKNKYKSEKRFEINEGYIDLEVLGEGDKVSFKTDLVENQGLIYYIFSRNGKMEAVEEKIHKVHKDEKEFKKLLEKFNKNEAFKSLKAKDFENVKKNYGTDIITMDNVYEDLYHMIFKNKSNFIELKKS